MRVLADSGDLHTPAGHIAVGWLVVEDLFTVLVLVLLPAVFAPGIGGRGHRPGGGRGPGQGRRDGGPDLLRRRAAHPVAARPGGGDPVPRALHADGARRRPGHRRRLGRSSSASRWRSGRSWPGWSSAGPSSACGRRPRRCRCGTPSPSCSSSRSACCSDPSFLLESPGLVACDARRRPARQAAGGPRHRRRS